MTDKFIIAHDMGTSSNKAVLVTVFGEIVDFSKQDYPIHHPQPGYAEQNPFDWWQAICTTTKDVMQKTGISPENVVGVTFSSQTQSLIPVTADGTPLMPSMSWLDGRSADIIREKLWMRPRILGYNIFHLVNFLRITGGSPGHTGKDQIGKLLWLQAHEPDIFNEAHKFIDAKDFILFQLTRKFVTSVDVAVIWWLLDTRKNRNGWHPGLCRIAGIDRSKLAEVRESSAIIGEITPEAAEQTGLIAGTPVINGAADLSTAALGSGAVSDGELHVCIGTSGWVAGHFKQRKLDLIHYAGCIGSAYPQKYYLGMAHQETAGICLEWLKNNILYHEEQLKQESNVSRIYQLLDQLAATVGPGAGNLLFTPWMYGERCPLDDDYVRGGLYNLSLKHSRGHLIRAVLEGIAFNTRWAMETLENLYRKVERLNFVGGGARSEIWCQILADITNRTINQVQDPQLAGARGIALLASMALGYIHNFHEISNYIKIRRTFTPDPNYRRVYDDLFREFKNLYKQNKKWYFRMNRENDAR